MSLPRLMARVVVSMSALVGIALLSGCPIGGGAKATAAVDDLAHLVGTSANDLEPYLAAEAKRLGTSQDDVAKGVLNKLKVKPQRLPASIGQADRIKACNVVTKTVKAAFNMSATDPTDYFSAAQLATLPGDTGQMWEEVAQAIQEYDTSGSVKEAFGLMPKLCDLA